MEIIFALFVLGYALIVLLLLDAIRVNVKKGNNALEVIAHELRKANRSDG